MTANTRDEQKRRIMELVSKNGDLLINLYVDEISKQLDIPLHVVMDLVAEMSGEGLLGHAVD